MSKIGGIQGGNFATGMAAPSRIPNGPGGTPYQPPPLTPMQTGPQTTHGGGPVTRAGHPMQGFAPQPASPAPTMDSPQFQRLPREQLPHLSDQQYRAYGARQHFLRKYIADQLKKGRGQQPKTPPRLP